jgi:hypothetical protein
MPETLLAPMFETTYSAGVLELSEPETTVWG